MSRSGSPVRSLLAAAVLAALFMPIAGATANAERFLPFAALPDFGAPLFYPQLAGRLSDAVATGDVNGDGRADLIVGQPTGVKVGLGDGAGGMILAGPVGTGAGPNAIALADLNGDSRLDIVTSNRAGGSGNTFSVLFGDGTGAFGGEVSYTVPVNHTIAKLTAGDVTGDGRADVVVISARACGAASVGCSTVTVWRNTGIGVLTADFSRPYATLGGTYYSGYSAVRVGDVDNDTKADLILTIGTYDYGGEPPVQIMRGLGNGTFAPTRHYRYPNVSGRAPFHTIDVEVADVNGDGWLDVVAMAQSSWAGRTSHVVVMRNDTAGDFPQASGSAHNLNWNYGTSPLVGDLNDDGKLDLVGTLWNGDNGGTFGYFLNDGTGNFPASAVSTWNLGGVSAAVLADLNGSGKKTLDLVMVRNNAAFTLLNGTILDGTAPVITPSVNGTLAGGWYTSNVTVSWSVTDPESPVTSPACAPQTVTNDTAGTTITCSATSLGGTSSQSVTIKRDTTGPAIASVTATPGTLWSPNHKMHAVTVSVNASDAGAGMGVCRVDSVASNEGGNQHEPDVELIGALTLNLRAERDGNAAGRIYTIFVSCKDAAGNKSTSTATVNVAHDQGKKK